MKVGSERKVASSPEAGQRVPGRDRLYNNRDSVRGDPPNLTLLYGNLLPKVPLWDLALKMLTTLRADVGEELPYLAVGHSCPTSTSILAGPPFALMYGNRVQFSAVIWEFTSTCALM